MAIWGGYKGCCSCRRGTNNEPVAKLLVLQLPLLVGQTYKMIIQKGQLSILPGLANGSHQMKTKSLKWVVQWREKEKEVAYGRQKIQIFLGHDWRHWRWQAKFGANDAR
jgi:hypothetical protein